MKRQTPYPAESEHSICGLESQELIQSLEADDRAHPPDFLGTTKILLKKLRPKEGGMGYKAPLVRRLSICSWRISIVAGFVEDLICKASRERGGGLSNSS